MNNGKINKEILKEIRIFNKSCSNIFKFQKRISLSIIPIILIVVSLGIGLEFYFKNKPSGKIISWDDVRKTQYRGNFEEALQLANSLLDKAPESEYGHKYIAYLYNETGDVINAEKHYLKAYSIFPSEKNEANLNIIRTKIEKLKEKL